MDLPCLQKRTIRHAEFEWLPHAGSGAMDATRFGFACCSVTDRRFNRVSTVLHGPQLAANGGCLVTGLRHCN